MHQTQKPDNADDQKGRQKSEQVHELASFSRVVNRTLRGWANYFQVGTTVRSNSPEAATTYRSGLKRSSRRGVVPICPESGSCALGGLTARRSTGDGPAALVESPAAMEPTQGYDGLP